MAKVEIGCVASNIWMGDHVANGIRYDRWVNATIDEKIPIMSFHIDTFWGAECQDILIDFSPLFVSQFSPQTVLRVPSDRLIARFLHEFDVNDC